MGTLFPIFFVSEETVLLQTVAAVLVGLVAAAFPAWRTGRVSIVDGLRAVG
jgi:putative ABC transport system permease protein